jgi:proteasome accessory factor A
VGDANLSELATFLKLGSTAIVLGMIEDGVFPDWLVIQDPVTEIRRVSHDISMIHRIQMRDGSYKTALEIQDEILEHAIQWVAGLETDPLGGECSDIIALWGDVLVRLRSNPESLADTIDWIAKRRILEAMRIRDELPYDHPRLKAIDLQYHELGESRSLFSKLGCRTICQVDDVARAMLEPPSDTRAFFRGKCISTWPQSVTSANWDSVVFDVGEATLQRIPMMDPLKGTERHVGHLFRECSTVQELLHRLSDDVEDVIEDPGW